MLLRIDDLCMHLLHNALHGMACRSVRDITDPPRLIAWAQLSAA